MATIQSTIDFVSSWRVANGVPATGVLNESQLRAFAEALQSQIGSMAATPANRPGAQLILYSGDTGNLKSWEAAQQIASSDLTKYFINDTPIGMLLNDGDFQTALLTTVGDDGLVKDLIEGKEINGLRTRAVHR